MRMEPTTLRRAWVGASAVALVVGVVAGCSGGGAKSGPSATAAPSAPTASASPTASPTPDASVKPVRPAAMDQVNPAGAEAVATYFLQLFPYIFASGDLTDWKALSHPECVYCASVLSGAEKMSAAGNRSEGGLVTVSEVRSTVINPGRWWLVTLTMLEQPSVTVDTAGKLVEKFPETKTYKSEIAVVWESERWLVRAVTHTRQG